MLSKYRHVHMRLHESTLAKIQRMQDELGATTYAEVIRYMVQRMEEQRVSQSVQEVLTD